MNAPFKQLLFAFSVASVLFYGQSDVTAQASDDLLVRLRAHYNSIEVLRAGFTQRATSAFGDAYPENSGTLILQGDHYRVETAQQTFVTNGQITWVYDAFQNQVLINDYVEDEATFSISEFLTRFDSDFEVTDRSTRFFNGIQHEIIDLASVQDDAFFKKVTLTVRPSDTMITRLVVTDVNDASLDFSLNDIEINPILDSDPFTFLPPDDAEIIDLRS